MLDNIVQFRELKLNFATLDINSIYFLKSPELSTEMRMHGSI